MTNFKLNTNPIALKENIVAGDKYRITVLSSALLRFEYNETGNFIDEATQVVINRDFPATSFKLKDNEDGLTIETENIKLFYNKKRFSSEGLKVKIYGTNLNYNSDWSYGMKTNNLGGTARTLDGINGATNLEDGVISRNGFALLDDSSSLIFNEDFVQPRQEQYEDIYLFCYGHEYKRALSDFYKLTGNTPLLPKFALGNWWSRYYRYTQDSYKALMENFDKEKIPFSVAVIDMDWHLVDIDPKYGSGWTGYTWNTKLFPDHKELLEWLHNRGMKVTLNVHPAEGVRGYEDRYKNMAKALDLDVENEEVAEFDCTNPKFLDAYFEEIHHPLEEEGVDFWWLDWQQGTGSKVPGLDPLWMLNHCHFLDNGRDGKRPLTFSRYAGPGSHRYPIGFSGDTWITWESLAFQPYFTATASNIGYGWWSHDIGGHMMGKKDNELELRWYQYGVFSPIMRLHSSCSEFAGKEPWNFPLDIHTVMNDFLRLRHRLIPYLYTMNYRAYKGTPLILPMYYHYPESWDAYEVKNQYFFGSELIVAPVVTPKVAGVDMAKTKVWLPDGYHFDIFTGTVYSGGRFINMYRDNSSIPVLAKAGAIIPMTDEIMHSDFLKNPQSLNIQVYTGADGIFTMYEDDGKTCKYLDGDAVNTTFEYLFNGGFDSTFTIKRPVGNLEIIPKKRSYKIELNAVTDVAVEVYIDGNKTEAIYNYDKETHRLTVVLNDCDLDEDITIKYVGQHFVLQHDYAASIYKILQNAQIEYTKKDEIYRAATSGNKPNYLLNELIARDLDEGTREAISEIYLACIY